MLRNIGAVVAGIIVGMIFNLAGIELNTVFFPAQEGVDLTDMKQLQTHMDKLPATAFLVVMVAHLGQSFFGGWVAARIAASHVMTMAMIIGVFSLVGGIVMMVWIKGPTWMYLELPLYLVVAWLAGRMEQNRRAPTA